MDTNKEEHRDPHVFRENMKKWRKIRGMSQDDLARKITENPPDSVIFHQQTIQKIENGNRGISLTDAVLIVIALDVDLNTMLMDPDGPDKTLDDRVKDRLRRDMHVAHLAVKELESTLKKLEEVYDIAPKEEQRESVERQINEGPTPMERDPETGHLRPDPETERAVKEQHDSLHEQIREELDKHAEVDHGLDN